MSKKSANSKLCHDSKELVLIIHDYLLDQRNKKCHSKRSRHLITTAADCLKKVYKIKVSDYILLKVLVPLEDICRVGYRPTTVKSRIAAEMHKRTGNNLMDSNQYELAERQYTKAIQLDPRNAIYHCNRAASRVRQGLLEGAVVDCYKALELDRNYAKAHCWLGLTHALMDQPAKAIRCYRKALRIDPGNPACLANMDLISKRMNRVGFKVLEPICRFSRALLARMMENAFRRRAQEPDHQATSYQNPPPAGDYDRRPPANGQRSSMQVRDYHIGKLD